MLVFRVRIDCSIDKKHYGEKVSCYESRESIIVGLTTNCISSDNFDIIRRIGRNKQKQFWEFFCCVLRRRCVSLSWDWRYNSAKMIIWFTMNDTWSLLPNIMEMKIVSHDSQHENFMKFLPQTFLFWCYLSENRFAPEKPTWFSGYNMIYPPYNLLAF